MQNYLFSIKIIILIMEICGFILIGYYGMSFTFLEKEIVDWGFDKKKEKERKKGSWLGIIFIIIGLIAKFFLDLLK